MRAFSPQCCPQRHSTEHTRRNQPKHSSRRVRVCYRKIPLFSRTPKKCCYVLVVPRRVPNSAHLHIVLRELLHNVVHGDVRWGAHEHLLVACDGLPNDFNERCGFACRRERNQKRENRAPMYRTYRSTCFKTHHWPRGSFIINFCGYLILKEFLSAKVPRLRFGQTNTSRMVETFTKPCTLNARADLHYY